MQTQTHDEKQMQAVAVDAAQAAGEILRRHAGGPLNVDGRYTRDLKLEVDRLCEEAIVGRIRESFPDHAILAEEGGASETGAGYRWIIDPLDGTVNYYYGLPYYCTSVACFATSGPGLAMGGDVPSLGRPVVGVVYAPPTDELFVGAAGEGATCNGQPISASRETDLAEIGFELGFGKTASLGDHMVDVAGILAGRVRKLRCLGAAAYDLSNVAAGRLGGFYEGALRTWDIAAGAIILNEAGGCMMAREFEPTSWRVLASGAGVHPELCELILSV